MKPRARNILGCGARTLRGPGRAYSALNDVVYRRNVADTFENGSPILSNHCLGADARIAFLP